MIAIENVSKHYGPVQALADVSFDVKHGEILGLLGPNGAGKTTTLKILSGFLHADQGRVTVGDHDVMTQPLAVQRMLGYLPEYNPVYADLLVYDYLHYVARMRNIPEAAVEARVRAVVETCGLREAVARRVGELSKGNRQRVGLAQAMIHDPEILILDEPTAGLDPNQIREIRALIKNLGREKTLIISSHILSEVEATCDRVVIIHEGRKVADGRARELQATAASESRIHVKLTAADGAEDVFQSLPGVTGVDAEGGEDEGLAGFVIRSGPDTDLRADIFRLAVERGWTLYELRREVESLESVFRQLTSR